MQFIYYLFRIYFYRSLIRFFFSIQTPDSLKIEPFKQPFQTASILFRFQKYISKFNDSHITLIQKQFHNHYFYMKCNKLPRHLTIQSEQQQLQTSYKNPDLSFSKASSAGQRIIYSYSPKNAFEINKLKSFYSKCSWLSSSRNVSSQDQSASTKSNYLDDQPQSIKLKKSDTKLAQKKQTQLFSKVFNKSTSRNIQMKYHQLNSQAKHSLNESQKYHIKNYYIKEPNSKCTKQYSSNLHKKIPQFVKNRNDSQKNNNNYADCFSVNDFFILKLIAEGKFGKVYLVRQKKTGMIMAMKQVSKQFLLKKRLILQFIRQLKLQSFLNHPHLIKQYGVFDDTQNIYYLMELGCDGHLFKFIEQQQQLSEVAISLIIRSLLQAVNYLHQQNILHRDIKPENIVLIHGVIKICDFGWAVHNTQDLRSTFCGTPLYFSPQLIKNRKYNQKIDLWAIGIIAYELRFFCSPFEIYKQSDIPKIVTKKISFPSDKTISYQFKQFLMSILEKDPEKRCGSDELLKLSFIRKYEEWETCDQLCI